MIVPLMKSLVINSNCESSDCSFIIVDSDYCILFKL